MYAKFHYLTDSNFIPCLDDLDRAGQAKVLSKMDLSRVFIKLC